mmetsp:Transcript_29257/g.75401  ORF Transcript_29257/g.75401 Transcript_29257/m.75401 type:complete len:674 (+) Transcript_29257:26-2047(+)
MQHLAMALLAGATAHIEVLSPPEVVGFYPDRVLSTDSPAEYEVNALVAAAASCPCDWLWNERAEGMELDGRLLLVPDGACDPSCSVAAISCAATLYNMTGLIVSDGFNNESLAATPVSNAVAGDALSESDFLAYTQRVEALGCLHLPGTYISSNTSAWLLGAVNWTVSTALPEHAMDAASAATNRTFAESAGLVPGAPTVRNVTLVAWSTMPPDDLALNVTIRRSATDTTVDCTKFAHVPIVYALTVPLWAALWYAWSSNTYQWNMVHAKDLHRLMSWVPIIETTHGTLALLNYSSCPWTSIIDLIAATFWSILTILKEPVILLCLLLVAKGWCITRQLLTRREVMVAGTILALLYASVSIQMSLASPLAQVPMVVMYLAILIEILLSVAANLRALRAQLCALRSLDVTDVHSTPVYRKYVMFCWLAWAVVLYASLEAIIHSIFSDEMHEQYFHWFIACHQIMELLVACLVGYTFRAQPFLIPPQQSAAVASVLADQMLPTMVTIELGTGGIEDKSHSLIAARADLVKQGTGEDEDEARAAATAAAAATANAPPTLLIVNPGDVEMPQPRRGTSSTTTSAFTGVGNTRAIADAAPIAPIPAQESGHSSDSSLGIELRSLRVSPAPPAELPTPALAELSDEQLAGRETANSEAARDLGAESPLLGEHMGEVEAE